MPSTPSFSTVSASSAARTASMLALEWWPIRSKRKPSTLYSVAHVTTESTMSFSIIACSVAVLEQHVLVAIVPSSSRRW